MELGLRPQRGAQALSRLTGLGSGELAAAISELATNLTDSVVRDVARLAERDDLLLFLEKGSRRITLQIALGAPRARIATTARRFEKSSFATGPLVDRLAERLQGARLAALVQPAGERRVSLEFGHDEHGRLSLEVELFGNRGLWALLDSKGRILELSRIPSDSERKIEPGLPWTPPRGKGATSEAPSRFPPPALAAIDAHFTAQDLEEEASRERTRVQQTLGAARKRLTHKIAGLTTQMQEIAKVGEVRRRADLLLAYSFGIQRGQTEVLVPDPDQDGATLRFELDPSKPIRAQIEAIYERARRLEDSSEIAKARLAETERELLDVVALEARLEAASEDAEFDSLRTELVELGWLAKPRAAAAPAKAKPDAKLHKATKGESFRRFQSLEGFSILCGKSNAQNDKLSLRVAAGNDLWFHVGQGYAGSHVVMRVPKGKTASLDSLLDAGTIAIHFSKARAATVCDVDYTFAKFVRKPKGFPPGKVTITQNKTLRVRLEKARLDRLLAGTSGEE